MSDPAELFPSQDGDPPASRPSSSTIVGPSLAALSLRRRHPSLIVVQGTEIGREYRIRRVEVALGRDESATIKIMDDRVSRRHARIMVRPGPTDGFDFILLDLNSTNGTWVNGRRVEEARLMDGDKVQAGDTVLKFILQDDLDARFHEEVRYRIAYDQLTGLLNKESLFAALDAELRRCERHKEPLSILMMDLDWFKSVNDQHGHLMGSLILAQVGQLLNENFRSTDISARYGGEEFVAYLAAVPVDEATIVAERIRGAMERHSFMRTMESGSELSIHVTISIGVSQFPTHGRTRDELIAAADKALYRAKAQGRNRVCLAQEE